MLATTSWLFPSNYIPARPSPLSPRSPNVQLPLVASMSQSRDMKKPTRFSARPGKANPIVQSRDAATAKRRDLFLKKVQQDRDDRRWEARGEQIMHLECVSQRRRYEAEKSRDAPSVEDEIDDADDLLPQVSQDYSGSWESSVGSISQQQEPMQEDIGPTDDRELEKLLQQEDEELEALMALMEEEEQDNSTTPSVSSHFGSDIDDYDEIFTEYLSSQNAKNQFHSTFDEGADDAMDTSGG